MGMRAQIRASGTGPAKTSEWSWAECILPVSTLIVATQRLASGYLVQQLCMAKMKSEFLHRNKTLLKVLK